MKKFAILQTNDKIVNKYLFYKFVGDKKNSSLHMAELQGLMASYFLRKSLRRPRIDM